jgi:epoxyqueuosine reductase QueG
MEITTHRLKQFAGENGADLVGVAPAARFSGAPPGHRPGDILPGAKSVLVCAQHIPVGLLDVPGTVYHHAMEVIHLNLDQLANKIALYLETFAGRAVPVPADEPYRHWEEDKSYGRGDLSHKHAAQAAGLGKLGKNSLLITPQWGNRVHLVSVVTDIKLAPDPLLDWHPCPQDCNLCQQACPAGAIGENQKVEQKLCRPIMFEQLPRGMMIENCRDCRRVCPVGLKDTS